MDGPLCTLADAPRQYQALLDVSQSVASHRDLTVLFRDLVERLPRAVSFDSLWLVLHDPARNRMRLHILEGSARETTEDSAWPLERPMEESPSALVWSTQAPLVVFDLAEDPRYLKAFQLLLDNGIRSCCILPLTSAHRRLGAVGFGYARPHNYSGADLDFLGQVARQIAVAVDNVLAHEEACALQAALAEERDRLRLLLDLNNTLAPNLDLRHLLRAVSSNVRRAMHCDYTSVILPEPDGDHLRIYARDFSELPEPMAEELVVPRMGTPAGLVLQTQGPCDGCRRTRALRSKDQSHTGLGTEVGVFSAADCPRAAARHAERWPVSGAGVHPGRRRLSPSGGWPGGARRG